MPETIEITEASTGLSVVATVVPLTTRTAKQKIDSKWWVLPEVPKRQRELENDHHWRWGDQLGKLVHKQWHEAVAIQTDDGTVQGATLYLLNTRSFTDHDLGAVFVQAIATAPHNRLGLVKSPLYRGVGEALLLRAVAHSYKLGLGGRVNLLAFNDTALIAFYKSRGFTIVGYDGVGDEKLPKLELTSDATQIWLRAEGYEQ